MKNQPILAVIGLMALASCNSSKDAPAAVAQKAEAAPEAKEAVLALQTEVQEKMIKDLEIDFKVSRKVELESLTTNKEEFIENLDRWSITVSSSREKLDSSTIECKTSNLTNGQVGAGGSASEGVTLQALDLGGTTYTCAIYDENGYQLTDKKINLKKSILVTKHKQGVSAEELGIADRRFKIATLFIDTDATLLTKGKKINIEMDEFISANGNIETFTKEEAEKTIENKDGASGGIINLRALRTEGELKLIMRGKNGGVRTEIPNQREERKEVVSPQDLISNFGALTGLKGHKGIRGTRGGDAGQFILNVKNDHNMVIDHISSPGLRGTGGAGGEGGVGAISTTGLRALPGDKGDVGADGSDGSGAVISIVGENSIKDEE